MVLEPLRVPALAVGAAEPLGLLPDGFRALSEFALAHQALLSELHVVGHSISLFDYSSTTADILWQFGHLYHLKPFSDFTKICCTNFQHLLHHSSILFPLSPVFKALILAQLDVGFFSPIEATLGATPDVDVETNDVDTAGQEYEQNDEWFHLVSSERGW